MRVHFRRVGIELAFQVAAHHLVAGIIMRVCAFALKQTASRFFRRRIAGIRMVMRALAFRQTAGVRPGHFVAAVIMDMRHVGVRRNVLGANQRACFRHAIRRVLVAFVLKQTASRFFRPIARIRVDVPLAFRQRAGQLFLPIVAGIRVLVHRMLLQRADKNAVAIVALLVMLVDVAIPVAAAEFALRIVAIGGMVVRLKAAAHNIGKDCLRLALGNQAGQLVHIAVRRVGMLLQPAVRFRRHRQTRHHQHIRRADGDNECQRRDRLEQTHPALPLRNVFFC